MNAIENSRRAKPKHPRDKVEKKGMKWLQKKIRFGGQSEKKIMGREKSLDDDEKTASTIKCDAEDLLIADTKFPEFDLETVPDVAFTDCSDDDNDEVIERGKKYETKEDQDVAVFLALMERMSLKSMLHLLQGHARASNMSSECMQQYAEIVEAETIRKPTNLPEKKLVKQKKFRFAEVAGGKVRAVVHEVESWKDAQGVWWKPAEMQGIRAELVETINFFRRHRASYIHSVEAIARGNEPEDVIESHMKNLTKDSYARGLESHIVRLLSDSRKATVRAVLREQSECRSCGDNYDVTSHCLREMSLSYSRMSVRFSEKIGRCDEIDSLKASMSRWSDQR